MKSDHRVLLCCFAAWVCCAVLECYGYLLDADGNTLKEENLADEDRHENGVIKSINIHEYLLVKSNPGNVLNAAGDEDAIKKKCKEICGFREEVLEEGEVECKSDLNHIECKCKGGNKMEFDYDAQICKICDCGDGATACNFEKGAVNCACKEKFAQREGKCEECACGRYSKGCSFQGNNKTCDCVITFGQKEDQCIACACGPYGKSCSFQGDSKTCDCFPNFFQKEDKCEDCACGIYATDCSFDGHTKACVCDWNYAQKEDQCVACDCGLKIGTASCHFDNGEKKCECKEGYMVINGWCADIAKDCESWCGHNENVTCEHKGNKTLCLCKEGKQFDFLTKTCIIPVNECEEMCGLDKEVRCEHKENYISCQCDEGKHFEFIEKKCKEDYHKQSGLSASEIAAIAVSLLVGIGLLASLYYFKYYKKSQSNRHIPDYNINFKNTL